MPPPDRRVALRMALESPKAPEREAAAVELCECAAAVGSVPEDFTADVVRLLADPSEGVRSCGLALAATVLPLAEALPLLGAHAERGPDGLRLEATGRLADFGTPEARPFLAVGLQDALWSVRFEAARGVAALQHPAGLEILVGALDRADYRFRALGALGELGDRRALEPVRRIFHKWLLPSFERTQAAAVLARLGDTQGAQHLLKVSRGKWSADRAMALELAGELKVEGAYDVLRGAVESPKDPCRGAAARGLGRLGDARALPVLSTLFDDAAAPEDFRIDAAEGLCRLGIPEALDKVRAALGTLSQEAQEELKELLA